MKVLKKKWMLFYSKVLAAGLTLLGFVSCQKESEDMYGAPVMYGVPTDSSYVDTLNHVMYGVTPVTYRKLEDSNEQPEQQIDGK